MTTKSKIAIVTTLAGFVLLLVWLSSTGSNPKKQQGKSLVPAKISTNWDDEFELLSKDANGLYLFNYFLKSKLDSKQQVSKIDHHYSLDTIQRHSHPTFIFIGEKLVLNELETDSLLAKVASGSKAFLAQQELNPEFYNRLFDNIELSYNYSTAITIHSESKKSYTFHSVFQSDTIAHKWRGYKNILTNTISEHKVLSKHGNLENNIALQVGKGYVYLCSNPELFVNFQLKNAEGLNHAKIWLNRIPEDESIYWLELGRFTKPPVYDPWEEQEEGDGKVDDSYLQYIFQQKSLVYAMILLLLGVLLYIIFRAKRTQPIVPYLSKKKNMTLVFADTITSIYFADRNPSVMLDIQKRNFYNAVQKHFFVDLSKRKETKEISILAQKSNVPESEIEDLINGFELNTPGVDENYLIQQAKKQLSFYRRTGMISQKVQDKIEAREFQLFRSIWISAILLLSGLFTIFLGFYYLVNAIGIGIVFWPIGALLLTVAVLRLSKPLLVVSKSTLTYNPLIGKQKKIEMSDVSAIETSEKGTKFRYDGGRFLIVNYWELNHMDALQFKRFVATQNKLKL